jgi:hypothetical protein
MGEEDLQHMEDDIQDSLEDIGYNKVKQMSTYFFFYIGLSLKN